MQCTLRILLALAAASTTLAAAPQRKIVPHNNPETIRVSDDGTYVLAGAKAELYGQPGEGKLAIYDGQMCIGWWNSPDDHVIWTVEAENEGPHDVWLHWSISDEWANNLFALECGPSRMLGRIPRTGGFDKFQERKFGQLYLNKGTNRVLMRPIGPVNGEIADLKSITLRPPDPAVPAPPEGGLPPEQALRTLRVPDSFEVALFASEPLISNPTSIVIDHRDRVWITEASVYRDPALPVDRIKVLEDTNGDGRCDRATIFADHLLAPMSLLVAGDQVFVAESPHLLVFSDKDGDLKADGPPRQLLTGFGGYNDDQALHGLAFGPDHRLWMTQGDIQSAVTGPDGARFKHDVGALLRCEFDGAKLRAVLWDLKNPIEVALNSFGEAWFSGNDDDGTRMTRLDFGMDGGFYGWRYWQVYGERRKVYGSGAEAHWHVNHFGVVPPVLITGFGAPCGKFFVEDDSLGPEYRDALFHADPGPRQLRAYFISHEGATPTVRSEIFLSSDTDTYFRPVDGAIAPDGSVFICDWYDQGVGGHAYNDPNRGRIYRIRKKDFRPRRVATPAEDPFAALANSNQEMQFQARTRILEMGARAIPPLTRLARGSNDVLAARALWLLGRIGGQGLNTVLANLEHVNPLRRALALRVLRSFEHFDARLYSLADDPSAVVRRELLLSLASRESSEALEAIVRLAEQWDGSDRFYLEAVGIAARGPIDPTLERFTGFRKGYETMRIEHPARLKTLFDRLVAQRRDELGPRTVALALLLQGTKGESYLLERLRREKLPPAARAAILGSLGPATDASFAPEVLGLLRLEATPPGLKKIALASLRLNLRGAWSDLKQSPRLREALEAALQDPRLASDAIDIISENSLQWAVPALSRLLSENRLTLKALDALANLRVKDSARDLLVFLKTAESAEMQRAAVTALVRVFEPASVRSLLEDRSFPPAIRHLALRELFKDSSGALWIYEMVEKATLPEDLKSAAFQLGSNHIDTHVRGLFLAGLPEDQRPKTLGQTIIPADILKLTGDISRGRNIFFDGAAGCAQCHQVQGRGTPVGPELSMIGKKFGREGILDAILNPSAAISPDYATAVVETSDGELLAGFLKDAGAGEYSLRTIANQMVTLNKSQVRKLTYQKRSLMPEQLAGAMTARDLADLVAFLASLDRETYFPPGWWVLGVFPNDQEKGFHHDFGPEKSAGEVNLTAQYEGVGGRGIRWEFVPSQPVEATMGFGLQSFVQARNFRSADLVAYLALAVESSLAQDATLLLGSEDAVKIWLNGKLVHENFVRRTPARLGQDTLELPLRKGRNLLLVKLEQVQGGGAFVAAFQTREPVVFPKLRR